MSVVADPHSIDAVFAELDRCDLPGAAVGIAIDGKPVYRKGFGVANMELPVLLSPTMRMRTASMTKHFTALSYLLLCEKGSAGLDDVVGSYLPELHPVTHRITMRQLMGHLSGLRDAHELSWHFSGTGQAVSSADLLSLYHDVDDVNAPPGVAWSYNNGGYLILTAAIERISGRTLEEVLRERIFGPVGMYDTLLRRWDTDFVPNSATLHTPKPDGGFEKSVMGTALAGEGGIVSSVDDILRWLAHMNDPVVGTPETWRAIKSPLRLSNGTSTGYGLGLITSQYRGVEILSHPGGVLGGNSQMLKVPSAGLDVVVLVNRHDVLGMLLVNKILDVCLTDLGPVGGHSALPLATGTFRSPTSGRVVQLLAREGQQIVSIDGDEMPFLPDDDGTLHPIPVWSYMKQTVRLMGNPERPTALRFSDFGHIDELRLQRPPGTIDVDTIAGNYRSSSTRTVARISGSAERARLLTSGRFGTAAFDLECLAEGIWRAKVVGGLQCAGVLCFDRGNGAFEYSTPRTRALTFRRES